MPKVFHFVIFLLLIQNPTAASQLLATFDYNTQGTFASSQPCTTFTFTIGHKGSHEFGDVILTPWPPPFLWQDGFSGYADLTEALDAPPFFHFTRMVESITDGLDEPLFFYGSAQNCNQILSKTTFITESTVLQTSSDLIGNNIDFIRVIINDLQFEQAGATSNFELSASYQFWGTPVPEPAAALLLALPFLAMRPRRLP